MRDGAAEQQCAGQPLPPPLLLPHPQYGVESGSARPAGGQSPHLSSRPPPPSHTSTSWASTVRGSEQAGVEEGTCPRQPPAVTTADFTALYERCIDGGLKARVIISYISGRQLINLSCSLPAHKTANGPAGRRRRGSCRRRCGTTATANVEDNNPAASASDDPTLHARAGGTEPPAELSRRQSLRRGSLRR
jgi:hypothetical protein